MHNSLLWVPGYLGRLDLCTCKSHTSAAHTACAFCILYVHSASPHLICKGTKDSVDRWEGVGRMKPMEDKG